MPTKLNRIYITDLMIAESMYRRTKERKFVTEDLMRLHWNRAGKTALEWARDRIKRMRKKGLIITIEPEKGEVDGRRRYYGFTTAALVDWGLVPKGSQHDPRVR